MTTELLPHTCNMCSYCTRTIENLTSHVCRMHKFDPRFHIFCNSCLRSYTKWDSYRKHVQRGCCMVSTPSMDESTTNSSSPIPTSISEDDNGGNEFGGNDFGDEE